MRLSVIVPFLNSHEIVRRQLIYLRRHDLPSDVEIIFVDDGSDPPLTVPDDPPRNFTLYPTFDYRPWTSSLARNRASKIAKGEWLLMVDGDYILPKEAILAARKFDGDYLGFIRMLGVLDENGELHYDVPTLLEWGAVEDRLVSKGIRLPPHPNHFVIRKSIFEMMGGYDEDRITKLEYPQREDNDFKQRRKRLTMAGKIKAQNDDIRPIIYMFPNGQFCGDVDANPFGLFHSLSRKTRRNYWYAHPRYTK